MYRVLYRKYRPRTFGEVCGQEHITSTLKNEVKQGRVSHAYLFTGSRGTGKTSSARILARAVNCPNSQDGEPCNSCEICRGLESGSIYDIVEIDAASNNGVDNIRELREEANYTPSKCKYRVYIIDEVHMLSQGAFNALLKTLEEPPEHVIFILATTEVHKLPATILSRCQRFDFKRVQTKDMTARLKAVAAAEGLTVYNDAAALISRIADGAVRNALSILDQCAGKSKTITAALVSEIAGLAKAAAVYDLACCVQAKDSAGAINIIGRLYAESYDMTQLCSEMINHFRSLMVIKTVKDSRELIICTDDEYESIKASAASFSLSEILFALDLLQNTAVAVKAGANARIEMEMCMMKLCVPQLDASVSALLARVDALERVVKRGMPSAVQAKARQGENPAAAESEINSFTPAQQGDSYQNNENAETAPGETAPEIQPGTPKSALPETAPEIQPPETVPEITPPAAPATAPETAQAAAPKPMPESAPAPAQQGETTEFAHWGEFLDMIYKSDIALYGVLSGSKGYVRGEFFLIDSPNPTVRQFIKIPTHSKAVKQALFDVTGKNYKLGLFKNSAPAAEKRDPLEELIFKARGNQNIEIQ
ncbi:MAG: DNA polymerase III subunit gamma/tau [Clostridiales bacterium]|nr:DNA polymerase III subunit gamma/tau [Clostridiales bacterium]